MMNSDVMKQKCGGPNTSPYFSALTEHTVTRKNTHGWVCSDLYLFVCCHVHQRLLINWIWLHKFGLGVTLQPCSAHPLPPVSITFSRDIVAVTAADVWKQYWSTAGEAAARTDTLLLSINDAFHGRWYKLLRGEQRPRARRLSRGSVLYISHMFYSVWAWERFRIN